MISRKQLVGAVLSVGFTLAMTAPAFADGGGEPAKCNSGRGNLSETVPETDCDPGNSGGNNKGGD